MDLPVHIDTINMDLPIFIRVSEAVTAQCTIAPGCTFLLRHSTNHSTSQEKKSEKLTSTGIL